MLVHGRVERLKNVLAAMSRVADQNAASRIDDKVKLLEWNLSNKSRNRVGNFHHIEIAVTILNRESRGLVDDRLSGPN